MLTPIGQALTAIFFAHCGIAIRVRATPRPAAPLHTKAAARPASHIHAIKRAGLSAQATPQPLRMLASL